MPISESFIRSAMLLGEKAESVLKNKKVAIFGIGGVGGNAAIAIARSGVGNIHIVDSDTVSVSNINRQVVATHSTVGRKKIDVMREMITDVSDAVVTSSDLFVLPENLASVMPDDIDYIVDAIDTVSTKLALCEFAYANSIPMISCMGMGNRLDPTQIRIGDISKVVGCPLARTMRRELKKRNVPKQCVCYSLEFPREPLFRIETEGRRSTPGSVAFVPSAAGIAMAGRVVCDLTNIFEH